MPVNMLEIIATNLGYPALQKIDANTQEVTVNDNAPDEHRFSQAAVPAILISLYNYSTNDAGAENILHGHINSNWTDIILGDKKNTAIQKIISYSGGSRENAQFKMNAIANEAVRIVKENMPLEATIEDVKKFMSNQRNKILPFLPEAIHMGEVLNNTTLDDNTHKMEGPISSLIRAIGEAFSEPVIDKELK